MQTIVIQSDNFMASTIITRLVPRSRTPYPPSSLHRASSHSVVKSLCLRRSHSLVARTRTSGLSVFTHTGLSRPTRCFSSNRVLASESHNTVAASESFPDPDRPDLFYHLFHPPSAVSSSSPVFALSFLPEPPQSVDSCTIIGWLPASAGEHQAEGDAGLNDFVENAKFRDLLHETIQIGLRDGVDDIQINGATQTQQGWMHIHDSRNIPALGRIGDPDDIIASVRVEDGKIMAETYQPMPAYRLCTSDGVMQLTEGLAARLVEVLRSKAQQGL